MAYLDLHEVGAHQDFISIVKMAILKKASGIKEENPALINASRAIKRQQLAVSVLNSIDYNAIVFAFHAASKGGSAIVVTDGELIYSGAGTIDSALDNIIDGLWDDRAGVTYEEMQAI